MKIRFLFYTALAVSIIVLAGCAAQKKQLNLPKDVTGTPAPYTGEAAVGEPPAGQGADSGTAAGLDETTPGLKVYQLNPDGTSQEIMNMLDNTTAGGETTEAAVKPESTTQVASSIRGIVVDKNGFFPSHLSLPVGTKLVIQNSDSSPHQPSSDPHPTHTDCPELNSGQPIAGGQIYEVVVTKTGTCGIHDHLNPELKATITITE